MIIKALDEGIFLKNTDTATDMKLQVLEADGITPVDLTDKQIQVVIGTDVGRVLVKTPTYTNELGHVHFGFDPGDLIGSGDYHLEIHISEGSEKRIAPSRGFYKLRVTRSLDEFQAEVTTVTLDALLDLIERRAVQGPIGPQGPIGLQGPRGDEGLKGATGSKGETGSIGPEGPRGLTGPQGEKGNTGERGLQGVQGLVGPLGPKGDTGPQGVQGVQGLKGETGSQGPIGLTGAKGDKGDQGIQGIKGDRGASFVVDATGTLANRSVHDAKPIGFSYLATDNGMLYLRQGATGWSPGIPFGKGDQGDVGPMGPQGLKGDQGIQGIKGDTGATGTQGIQGIQGPQGAKGDTGSKGLQGDAGPQGEIGLQGPKGDTGATGIQGIQGLKGDTGTKGADGIQGPQGLKGDTGLQGIKGDTGIQGPKGDKGDKGDTGAAGTTTWAGITDKPTSFTPATHSHTLSQVSGGGTLSELTTTNKTDLVKALNEINAKPTGDVGTTEKINSIYRAVTGLQRYQAYDELLKEASSRLDGGNGTVFAHDMGGNIIGMTLDEANSQNIVIRDGKMMMIAKSEVQKTATDATVVASAYDTSGNGGRKLVRLSNGWLVASVHNTSTSILFYASKDNGLSWLQLTYLTIGTTGGFSIVNKGTSVYCLIGNTGGANVLTLKFDAITVTNTNQTPISVVDTSQTSIGNVSITINTEGTELHATWASKNATYPNSFNIRYAKGVISQVDGSVTWGTVEQVTSVNSTNADFKNPSIIIDKESIPCISFEGVGGKFYSVASGIRISTVENSIVFAKRIKTLQQGSSIHIEWSGSNVYEATSSYVQSSPSAIFVPKSVNGLANGRIWVAWHGFDSGDVSREHIRISYSDDGGITWSAMQKLTSGSLRNGFPSITVNSKNKIFITFGVNDAYSLGMITWESGVYSARQTIKTPTGSTGFPLQSTLYDYSLDFSTPLLIYMDSTASKKVGFYGTWQEPVETPTLTAKAVYDIPSTDFVGAFVKKIGATTVKAYVNDVEVVAELSSTVDERKFIKQLATVVPVKLRLDLSRGVTTGGENDAVTRILGGRA